MVLRWPVLKCTTSSSEKIDALSMKTLLQLPHSTSRCLLLYSAKKNDEKKQPEQIVKNEEKRGDTKIKEICIPHNMIWIVWALLYLRMYQHVFWKVGKHFFRAQEEVYGNHFVVISSGNQLLPPLTSSKTPSLCATWLCSKKKFKKEQIKIKWAKRDPFSGSSTCSTSSSRTQNDK